DRAQPQHRGTDGDAGEAFLRDRGVPHPAGTELLEQALRDLVRALERPDLLADEEDVLITLHLGAQGGVEGLAVTDDGHVGTPVRGVGQSVMTRSPGIALGALATPVE